MSYGPPKFPRRIRPLLGRRNLIGRDKLMDNRVV